MVDWLLYVQGGMWGSVLTGLGLYGTGGMGDGAQTLFGDELACLATHAIALVLYAT